MRKTYPHLSCFVATRCSFPLLLELGKSPKLHCLAPCSWCLDGHSAFWPAGTSCSSSPFDPSVKNWKSTWAQAVPWYQKLKQQVSIIEQDEPSIPSHAQKFQHQLVKILIQIDAASAILFWCFHDFHLASATFRLLRLLFRLLATSDTCVQSQPPIGRTLASASYLMNSCLCFRTRLPSSEKRGKNPTTFVDISYHISTAF